MQDFLTKIPPSVLTGVKFAVFDTCTDMEKLEGSLCLFGRILDRFGYAAPKIAPSLEQKGDQMVGSSEGFIVKGTEGPLEDGELERAIRWGRQFAS